MPTTIPVVLVTGASRGLGKGIAIHCAKLGFSVAINYAGNRKAAEATVEECSNHRVDKGQRFVPVQANVGSPEDRIRLVETIFKEFGRIDALVNNAGIGPRTRSDITEMTEESFQEVLGINLQGAFFLTQAVARHWLKGTTEPAIASGFKIIFISSVSADSVSLNRGEYCISKAGLSMASKLWAARLAGDGMQVYELRPGIMLSDMTSGVKEKYDTLLAEGLVPQKRWGTAEDVAQAVGSILSGQFPFSTGSVISIDGGLHLHRF
jgi:NAD(P)-dependent dehydrogenase (short-subunit alcohol dehydrogenase family)